MNTHRARTGADIRVARFLHGRLTSIMLAARRAAGPTPAPRPGPLVVSGFLNETLGIGRGAKLTLAALQDAGFDPAPHDLRAHWRNRAFSGAPAPAGARGVWLLHCNPPEAVASLAKANRDEWKHVYRIGYWAYELERVPRFWRSAASLFHEIWVPSRFVADALKGVRTPVRVMPHPVTVEAAARERPPELAADKRHVLAAGDLRSSVTRKNLLGAVRIYCAAFPNPDDRRRLVLKLVTRDEDTAAFAELRRLAGARSDIILITRDMSDAEAHAVLAHCDVLLHPHRAEGFGLMIAEAFLLGVPALATNWSGNVDYMAPAPGLLLPASLIPVRDPDGVYAARNARWADPDIAEAAQRLRAVLADPAAFRPQVEAVRAELARQRGLWSAASLRAMPFARYLDSR
ncbi:MAG: glycosyltransferase [Hydrogenophilaceae bacterium]|jgi:glycosyltransferase involved in cell wall biosynthesis|nr:glycosyltransferase [Hydrogenophilaceae bacterium]